MGIKKQEIQKQQFIENVDGYKKKKYTIRMDVTLSREMSYEEAEKVIMNALRNAGMIGHCGGIS